MAINLFAIDLQGSPIPSDPKTLMHWMGLGTHTQGKTISATVRRGDLKLPDNVSCEFFHIADENIDCPCVIVVLVGPRNIHEYSDIGKGRIYKQMNPILNGLADRIGKGFERTVTRHMVTGETVYELYGDLTHFNNHIAQRLRRLIKTV